jgi:hypothetical protein
MTRNNFVVAVAERGFTCDTIFPKDILPPHARQQPKSTRNEFAQTYENASDD